MSDSSAPAGWYPDTNAGVLRYWDGNGWTEHTAPLASGPPTASSSEATAGLPAQAEIPAQSKPQPVYPSSVSTGHSANSDGEQNFWERLNTGWKVAVGIVAAILVIGMLSDSDEGTQDTAQLSGSSSSISDDPTEVPAVESTPSPTPTPTPKPKPKPKPQAAYGKQPKLEREFVSLIASARKKYESAGNDLQQGAALSGRDKKLCSLIGGMKLTHWQGKLVTLESNGEGKGVVGIEIAKDVQVKTWNNAFSDAGDETMIEAGPLLNRISGFKQGQIVQFGGRFVEELGGEALGGQCVSNTRFTKQGKVREPEFIFDFTNISRS